MYSTFECFKGEVALNYSSKSEINSETRIVLIEKRAILRDFMVRGFSATCNHNIDAKADIKTCLQDLETSPPTLIILSRAGFGESRETKQMLNKLAECAPKIPVVVLSDTEDAQEILDYLQLGAKGCIPTSLSLDVAIEAIHLVIAGGIFIPANSLTVPDVNHNLNGKAGAYNGMFTTRQLAVIDGLCRGKQNKIIAYELKLSESTIKVHVRNIMKKLSASNRTEVAFIINEHYANGSG